MHFHGKKNITKQIRHPRITYKSVSIWLACFIAMSPGLNVQVISQCGDVKRGDKPNKLNENNKIRKNSSYWFLQWVQKNIRKKFTCDNKGPEKCIVAAHSACTSKNAVFLENSIKLLSLIRIVTLENDVCLYGSSDQSLEWGSEETIKKMI